MLSQYDRHLEEPEAVDPETRRRLEALGYVGGASTTEDDVLPDPKDRVHWMVDIQRAYNLYHDGDLESAVPAFQRILEENPNIEDVWGYLSLAQLELGRPDEAAATFLAALEQLPSSGRLSLRAARLLDNMGRLDEAFVYANRAVSYDPPAAHLLLAQIAFKKGDLEGAEVEALEAISSGDRTPGSRLILADIYLSRGKPKKAIDLLTGTLEEGITDDSIYAKLAVAYAWIGEFDRAREILKRFEEINDLGLLLTFGRLALSRQLWGEARDWFERALVIEPTNPTVKLNLGVIAMNEGRLTDARKLIQESLAANLNSFEGWSALGMVFARQGDAEGAVLAWEKAHEVNPDVIDILFNLGLGHAQLGHLSQAIGYLEDYAANAPPGPQQQQALALVQRLRLQASQGR